MMSNKNNSCKENQIVDESNDYKAFNIEETNEGEAEEREVKAEDKEISEKEIKAEDKEVRVEDKGISEREIKAEDKEVSEREVKVADKEISEKEIKAEDKEVIEKEVKAEEINNKKDKNKGKKDILYTDRNKKISMLLIAIMIGIIAHNILFAKGIKSTYAYIGTIASVHAAYFVYNLKKLKTSKVMIIYSVLLTMLYMWYIFFDVGTQYGILTIVVLPISLMVLIQFSAKNRTLKQLHGIVGDFFIGWFVYPFTQIGKFIAIILNLFGRKMIVGKILISLCICFPILLILLPLLSRADMMFRYYLQNIFINIDIYNIIIRLISIFMGSILVFSFLWNVNFVNIKENKNIVQTKNLDTFISYTVLGVILTVYMMFCIIQFRYLFAGAGLPAHMTYSKYAREGFGQLIAVNAINMIIFGIYQQYAKASLFKDIMLSILLVLTAIMIVSGIIRLNLYIEAYGLTWLRLISAWFIIYLIVVLVMCIVRMLKEAFPLLGTAIILLLAWYVFLGYINPQTFVDSYNEKYGYEVENRY